MKKIISIIFIATILISYLNIKDVKADVTDINEPPEDILLYPDTYQPRVVSSYDLETPSGPGQGSYYPVFITLKGMKTNPILEIPRIDSISVTLDQAGSKYASAPTHRGPIKNAYSLDNMGYLIVYLNKNAFKKDAEIPESIDLDLKARINYRASLGFGLYQQDLVLKESSEQDFFSDKSRYGFWNGRGYLRLEKLDNNMATISVYDSKGVKIKTLSQLNPGQTSEQIFLSRQFFENNQLKFKDRATVTYAKLIGGEKSATLQFYFNNKLEYIQRFEGEQLYPGSAWRIKNIISGDGKNEVTIQNSETGDIIILHKNRKSTIYCGLIDNQNECNIMDECTWVGACINKNQQATIEQNNQQTTSRQRDIIDPRIKEEFDSINNEHKTIQKSFSSYDEQTLKAQAESIYNEIKSKLEDPYLAFMKKYPESIDSITDSGNAYFQMAKHRLTYSFSGTTSVWSMYDHLYSTTKDERYKNFRDELLKRTIEILNMNSAESTQKNEKPLEQSFNLYYKEAIDYYQKIVNSYAESTLLNDKTTSLGPIAQRKIGDIYKDNLYNIDKTIVSYKLLLEKFSDTEYVKSQQEEINKIILLLEAQKNYDTNKEEILEEGNAIGVTLSSVDDYGESSRALITVDGEIINRNGYKSGETIDKLDGWSVDEINTNSVKLVKLGDNTKVPVNLRLNTPITLDNIKLVLTRTETKSKILVTVSPADEKTYSVTRFKVHIPIEKRMFRLTPEQIDHEIEATNNIINNLDSITDKLGKFNTLYTGYCYLTAAYMFAKNQFANKFDVRARKEVMDKWKDYCTERARNYNYVNEEQNKNVYTSLQSCLSANKDDLEADVEKAREIVEQVENDPEFKDKPYLKDAKIKELITKNEIAQNREPDLINKYVDEYLEADRNAKILGERDFYMDGFTKNFYDDNGKFNPKDNFDYVDLKRKYPAETSVLMDSSKSSFEREKNLKIIMQKESLSRTYGNEKKYIENGASQYDELGADTRVNEFFARLNTPQLSEQISKGILPFDYSNIISDENSLVYLENGDVTRRFDLYIDDKATVRATSANVGDTLYTKKGVETSRVIVVTPEEQETFSQKIALSQDTSTKGRLKDITIDPRHYIEIDKRGVDSNIITISIWASKNDYELGTGSLIDRFDYSSCNEKIREYYERGILTKKENRRNPCDIVKDAENEINNNFAKYKNNDVSQIFIKGNKYLLEMAIHQQSSLECTDIFPTNDCRLLAGACDPVMCPSSRFDLNGRWKVDNVIQTGIAGGIVLGIHNFDPPYEMLPVCTTGINAGIKNIESIFQGYNQCLQRAKLTGESIGGCSYVRSLGFCKVAWGTTTALFNVVGPEKIISLGAKAIGKGGNEYVANFQANLKRSGEFAKYFTSTYGQSIMAAYKGKGTEEIGSVFCESAIFGRLPGQGNMIEQLLRPSVPAQFFAIMDESPHAEISGERQSNYRIFYNIYAGEDHDIRYLVSLRNSKGDEKQATYYTLLPKGQTSQMTVNLLLDEGYNEICVTIDGIKKCGFGKISTEFAISYAQEKMLEKESQRVVNNAAECMPRKNVVIDNPDIVTTPLGLLSNGVKETGVVRRCSSINPGLGTNEQDAWVERGTCGADDKGRDLGKCWLDMRTLSFEDEKNRQKLSDEMKKISENLKPNQEIIDQLNDLESSRYSLEDKLTSIINTIKRSKSKSSILNKKDEMLNLEQEYLKLASDYIDLISQTIDPNLLGNINFGLGEVYASLGSLKYRIENLEKITEKTKEVIESSKTNKCKLTPNADGTSSYICDSVTNGETVSLIGSQISVKAIFSGDSSGDRLLSKKLKMKVYTGKDSKQYDCGGFGLLNSDLILNKELEEKECNNLLIIKWINSKNNENEKTELSRYLKGYVSFSVKLLEKGIVYKKEIISPILITDERTPSSQARNEINKKRELINDVSQKYNLPPTLLAAIISWESQGNEKAISKCGAAGLAQFTYDTARGPTNKYFKDPIPKYDTIKVKGCSGNIPAHCRYGFSSGCDFENDPRFDADKSIIAIGKFVRDLADNPNSESRDDYITASYNGGPGAVKDSTSCPGLKVYQCTAVKNNYGETRKYVPYVLSYKAYYDNHPEILNEIASDINEDTTDNLDDSNLAVIGPGEVENIIPEVS